MSPAIVTETGHYKIYLWDGVTPTEPGKPVVCDEFKAREVQIEGDFVKAYLDASCGGEWEPVVSMSIDGIQRVESSAPRFRPRVEGEDAKAKFYLVVRR